MPISIYESQPQTGLATQIIIYLALTNFVEF